MTIRPRTVVHFANFFQRLYSLYDFRMAGIADFRLLMNIGRSCHTTFSIVNRQSAIGNENLVFGCRRRPRSGPGSAVPF
jgi:hypothetical protein